jgi:hypothetical protein
LLTLSVFQDVHIGFLGEFCFWPEAIISNPHWPCLLKDILPRRWQEWQWGRLPWWRSSLKSCRDMCLARGAGVIFLINTCVLFWKSRAARCVACKQGQPSSANRFISQSKSQGVKLSSPATVSDIIYHSSGPPPTLTIICWPEVHEVINSIY